jgi:hypothetical protein
VLPSDVFNPNTHWQFVLAKAATAALRRSSGGQLPVVSDFYPGSSLAGMAKIVSDPRNWVITTDGLKINFNDGDVTGYDGGLPSTVVDWAVLKPVLKTDGLAGR